MAFVKPLSFFYLSVSSASWNFFRNMSKLLSAAISIIQDTTLVPRKNSKFLLVIVQSQIFSAIAKILAKIYLNPSKATTGSSNVQ